MTRVFKGLFKWSLEITGVSIILFNYQSFERQQQMIALYNSGRNTIRTVKHLYGVINEAKELFSMSPNTPEYDKKLQEFIKISSVKLEQLCEANKGVYARIGQIISGMTGVLPLQYLIQFKKLNNINAEQVPYQNIKNTLTQSLSKPMTELFDGFQKKPTKVGLLFQEHKSILLQNFKQSIVKVVPPSTRYQCHFDLWVINKFLTYLIDYSKKNQSQSGDKLAQYVQIIKQAQNFVLEEVDFDREVKNADKMAELIQQQGSTLYFPYYYKKYANKNVVIKQNVQGTSVFDSKGLKELGLTPELAYAFIMSDVHKLMKKMNLINGEVGQNDFVIRKYIKPAKRSQKQTVQPQNDLQNSDKINSKRARSQILKKGRQLIHPPYQVVFTNLSTLRQIPNQTKDEIQNYWVNMKKNNSNSKKYLPSIGSFYQRIPILNNLKDRPAELMKGKYYLYQSMLKLYETMTQKKTESQK